MGSSYQIRIYTDEGNYNRISQELNILPTSSLYCWEYAIGEGAVFFENALDHLLSVLMPKMKNLRSIGIQPDDISIWYLYEYKGQCNIEFDASELKKMGDLGVALCISCWENDT